DSLLNNAKYDTALAIVERLLRDQPNNWEALYREGATLGALEKHDEAARPFQALLKVTVPDDEQSVLVKAKKKGQQPGRLASPIGQLVQPESFPLQDRVNNVWQVRVAAHLESRYNYGG